MCAASVPDSALSASSLPVIYLQAFLTFPLAFPSFLPSSRSCFSYFPSSPTFRLPIYSLHSCFASLYYVLFVLLCPFSLLSSSCFHVRLLSSSFYPFFIYFSFLIPHFLPFSCPCLHPSSIASSSPSCLPPCSFEFTLFLTILFYFSSSLWLLSGGEEYETERINHQRSEV